MSGQVGTQAGVIGAGKEISGDFIAPSFLDTVGLHFLLPLELDGRQHPVPDMLTFRIVEHLDVVEHILSGLNSGLRRAN